MSFSEGVRAFWIKVADNKCQVEIYGERSGFKECKKPARHVHHIHAEATTLEEGEDPNHNVGLPLCEDHHVRNTNDEEWSEDFAFHTDIAGAFGHYKEWKANKEHMNSITGKRAIDYSDSPFAEVAHEQHQKAKNGERYVNGTEEIDQYYEEKMREKAVIYQAKHPEEKKPTINENNKTDHTKRKRWWNLLG